MSKAASSVLATRLVSAASRLTPRLILPDLTMTVVFAASAIFASSAAEQPVVPMTCTLPALAASATRATVAAGTVKSTMPSALSRSDAASAVIVTPLAPMPASSPASLPRSGDPAPSMAPASARPLVSAMAFTSVRPMRPPAPATISRMSDICARSWTLREGIAAGGGDCHLSPPIPSFQGAAESREPGMTLRLRAVVALDDDEIRHRMRLPYLDIRLVFRRIVAGERGGVVGKLDHHVARARRAFRVLELARAHDEAAAEFLEDGVVGERVGLVALVAVHVDAPDPVSLGHSIAPVSCAKPARCPRRLPRQRPWDRRHRRSAGRRRGNRRRPRWRAPAS